VKIVAVDILDPLLEQVAQSGERVLADRDQEVSANVSAVNAGSKLFRETSRPYFRWQVKEVLLKLIEHHKQRRAGSRTRGVNGLFQALMCGHGRRGFGQERDDRSLNLGNQLIGGFVSP